jgi:group I intron endonuclease
MGSEHQSGVYRITVPDGRFYVGSAVHFGRRWSVHRHRLGRGTHHNPALQAIAAKHGVDALRFERLIVCAPVDAVSYEQAAMDALRPALNAAPVAGSTLGYRHREDTKAAFASRRRSAGNTGKQHSVAAKAQISAKKAGKPSNRAGVALTDATKQKISAALAGRKNSPEQIARQKVSFAAAIQRRRAASGRV